MDIKTCYKYFQFLNTECDRHLNKGSISEDEIRMLKTELDRFKEKLKESSLPPDIVDKTSELNLKYSVNKNSDNIALIGFVTFGIWFYIYRLRKQTKMKAALQDFKSQVSSLPIYVKMNYEF